MTADTAQIEVVVGTTVSVALRNILMGIGGIIYLFVLAPGLTLTLLIAVPLIILPIAWFGRRLRHVSREKLRTAWPMSAPTFLKCSAR